MAGGPLRVARGSRQCSGAGGRQWASSCGRCLRGGGDVYSTAGRRKGDTRRGMALRISLRCSAAVRDHSTATIWRGWGASGMRERRVRRALAFVYLTDTFGGAVGGRVTACWRQRHASRVPAPSSCGVPAAMSLGLHLFAGHAHERLASDET